MKVFVRADTHVSSTILDTAPKPKFTMSQLITAITVSLVSMVIGYSSAYTSPAQSSLEKEFGITTNQMSWISSFLPLGALFGGICGGTLIEYLGRKWTILLTNLFFLAAWVINYSATNCMYLYSSRIINGIGVGIASLTLPVYLSETLQPEVRGTLSLLPASFGNLGILICFSLGIFYQWKTLALIGGILSTPLLLLIWWIPETPTYLISKGKEEKSRKSLRWLRGPYYDTNKEFVQLQNSQNKYSNRSKNINIMTLLSKNIAKLLFIIIGLMFFQQMSGITAVIFYTRKIFKDSGSNLDENICATIVGVVNFISTFIATILIDKSGRKILLYISSVLMIISLGALGAYFYLKDVVSMDLQQYGWTPLVSLMVYILGFSLGFGPIPWLMMGEILPAKFRGQAASLCTGFAWTYTFLVTKNFLLVIDVIGTHYTFWMFGCFMLAALLFTIIYVPETKGQSLDDIERKLAGVKVRPVSSIANLRPMPSIY